MHASNRAQLWQMTQTWLGQEDAQAQLQVVAAPHTVICELVPYYITEEGIARRLCWQVLTALQRMYPWFSQLEHNSARTMDYQVEYDDMLITPAEYLQLPRFNPDGVLRDAETRERVAGNLRRFACMQLRTHIDEHGNKGGPLGPFKPPRRQEAQN
eukprot:GHVT01053306.1.p2 GENE.GHVT01053306.1~~GHVT01053306.1.p2  ORF type:complete len:156 (-),score=20.18 GHVT01053306.1:363-830(-)